MAAKQDFAFNVPNVAMTLRKIKEFYMIQEKLPELRLHLNTPDIKWHVIRQKLQPALEYNLLEALLDLLNDWKTREPKVASIPKLIEFFRECQLNLHAEKLHDELLGVSRSPPYTIDLIVKDPKSVKDSGQVQNNEENCIVEKVDSNDYGNEETEAMHNGKLRNCLTYKSKKLEQNFTARSNLFVFKTIIADLQISSNITQIQFLNTASALSNESMSFVSDTKQETSEETQPFLKAAEGSQVIPNSSSSNWNGTDSVENSKIKIQFTEHQPTLTNENKPKLKCQNCGNVRNHSAERVLCASSSVIKDVSAISMPVRKKPNILDSREASLRYECTMIFSALLPIFLSLLIPCLFGFFLLKNRNNGVINDMRNSSVVGTNFTGSQPVMYVSEDNSRPKVDLSITSPTTSITELIINYSKPTKDHGNATQNSFSVLYSPLPTNTSLCSDGDTKLIYEAPAVHASGESYLSERGFTSNSHATSYTKFVLNFTKPFEEHKNLTDTLPSTHSSVSEIENPILIDLSQLVITNNVNVHSFINISKHLPALTELILDNRNYSLCNGTSEQYMPDCPAKFPNLLILEMYNTVNCSSLLNTILICIEASKLQNFVFAGEIQENTILQLNKMLNRFPTLLSASISGTLQTDVSFFHFRRKTVFGHIRNWFLDLHKNVSTYLDPLHIVPERFCNYFPQVENVTISRDMLLDIYQYKTLLLCKHLKYITVSVIVYNAQQVNDIINPEEFSSSLLEFRLTVNVVNFTLCGSFRHLGVQSKWLQSIHIKELCCFDYGTKKHVCSF